MNKDKLIFPVFLTTFFSTLLAFDGKSFFAIFILAFFFIFFFAKKNILESAYITFILTLPFENSIRDWVFYNNPIQFPNGYAYYFGICPKLLFGIMLFFLCLTKKNRSIIKKNISNNKESFFLILFIITAFISSVLFHALTNLILLGLLRLWLALWFFFSTLIFFNNKDNIDIFKKYFISLSIFIVFIGSIQYVIQKPIGSFVELTPIQLDSGYVTTDGVTQYRVSSFISHPVFFGSFMSIIIPILFGTLWTVSSIKEKKYLTLLNIIVLVVTIGALSRSTWATILGIFIFFYYYWKKYPIEIAKIKINKFKQNILIIICLVSVLIPAAKLIETRIKSINDLKTVKGGSLDGRMTMAIDTLAIIRDYPITGVGINNITLQMMEMNRTPDEATPVHNTFLLFLSELGIPSAIFYILFTFTILLKGKKIFNEKPIVFGAWVGLFFFIMISSQIHPLFNSDPTFDLFMFVSGFLSICTSKT